MSFASCFLCCVWCVVFIKFGKISDIISLIILSSPFCTLSFKCPGETYLILHSTCFYLSIFSLCDFFSIVSVTMFSVSLIFSSSAMLSLLLASSYVFFFFISHVVIFISRTSVWITFNFLCLSLKCTCLGEYNRLHLNCCFSVLVCHFYHLYSFVSCMCW
jgi:hypothetical protein